MCAKSAVQFIGTCRKVVAADADTRNSVRRRSDENAGAAFSHLDGVGGFYIHIFLRRA